MIEWTYEVEKNGVLNLLDSLLKKETHVSFTTALNITLHGHIAWGAMKMTIFKYGNGMVGILKEIHTDLLCMLYNTN